MSVDADVGQLCSRISGCTYHKCMSPFVSAGSHAFYPEGVTRELPRLRNLDRIHSNGTGRRDRLLFDADSDRPKNQKIHCMSDKSSEW
jgi:hypothetical protein